MLYYLEAGISPYEVPNETSLVVYISGCKNNCPYCHYSDLQKTDYGSILMHHYKELITIYQHYITCVCFLGEGDNDIHSRNEFSIICQYIKSKHLKACLYSGRDCGIEKWMYCFDYIKLGNYKENRGPLTSESTNQKLYKRVEDSYIDITYNFWK